MLRGTKPTIIIVDDPMEEDARTPDPVQEPHWSELIDNRKARRARKAKERRSL